MSIRDKAIEYFYPGLQSLGLSMHDSTMCFYSFVDYFLAAGDVLLDFGAGRGWHHQDPSAPHHSLLWIQHKKCRRVGVDVDPIVLTNPILDEAHILRADQDYALPLNDESCDVIIADWVVEHLNDPLTSFRELRRVLRPNGRLCIRNSNRWHYSYVLAALVSNSKAESWLLSKSQPDRKEIDVFPKYYRANSTKRLGKLLRQAGFRDATVFTHDSMSGYMNFSFPTTVLGGGYHRIAAMGLLPRAVLMGFAVK